MNDRLYAPVRGNATLTWASVVRDDFNDRTPRTTIGGPEATTYAPFPHRRAGKDSSVRCDDAHHRRRQDVLEPGNTRHILLPGEPFGVAMSPDGTSLVMTHQSDTEDDALSRRGWAATIRPTRQRRPPSLQFYVDNAPIGGVGVTAVPHDPDAFLGARVSPRPGVT